MGVASLNGVQVSQLLICRYLPGISLHPGLNFPNFFHDKVSIVVLSVHGSPEASSDACQAPARPDLPAACATAQSSFVHLRPAAVPGSALDPQVHCGCHNLPCHGEFTVRTFPCAWFQRAPNLRGEFQCKLCQIVDCKSI